MLTQDSQEALKSRLSNIAPKAGLPTGLLPSASRPRALGLVYFIYVRVISLTANLLKICNFDEEYELLHHHRPHGTTCAILFRDLFTLFSNELICPNDVSNQIALFFFLFLQLTHRKHLTRLHYFFSDALYVSCTSMMTLIIFKNALFTV